MKGTYHPEILKILKGTEFSEIWTKENLEQKKSSNTFLQKANKYFQKADGNRLEALASMLNLIFISKDISQLKNLQTNYPELINFDLMKKAFKKRKDLIDFVEFGLNVFSMNVKKTIPFDKFPEQAKKAFPLLPSKYRTEEVCFEWIKGKKNVSISSFNKIPKKVQKKLCRDNKEFRDILLSVLMNQHKYDVNSTLLNDLFYESLYNDQSDWEDESKILFYLEIMLEHAESELIPGFNDYPSMIKKSAKVQQAILPSLRYIVEDLLGTYCDCSYDESQVKEEMKDLLDKHSDFFSSINIEFFKSLDREDMSDFFVLIQVHEYYELDYYTPLQLAFFQKQTKKIPDFRYIRPTILVCEQSC
tara:strand:- start:94 stop:1173 length:1080 start_codon:yes stop_codon:yes gene_type:complete